MDENLKLRQYSNSLTNTAPHLCCQVGFVLRLRKGIAGLSSLLLSFASGWGGWVLNLKFTIASNFCRSLIIFEKGPKLSHGPKYFGPDLKNILFPFYRYHELDEPTSLAQVVKDSKV